MQTGELIKRYMEFRAKKEEIEEEAKKRLEPIQTKMQMIEAALQKIMVEQGLKNLKSEYGTAYLTTAISAKIVDRQALIDYVKSTDRWDVIDLRANKTAIKEEESLPGVEVTKTLQTRIRVN